MNQLNIKSLGYRSDLIFPNFDGVLKDRGTYFVIETPSNPHFHWGNFLLFKVPPAKGDLKVWSKLFKMEFTNPEIKHLTFGWDTINGEKGSSDEFVSAGFIETEQAVLVATSVIANKNLNSDLVVRPLNNSNEWLAALENQIACRQEIYSYDDYKLFKASQFQRYQNMEKAGLGFWFGAFIGDTLVGDLGIFSDGDIGRFQNVGTNPEYRRKGICGTLVYKASQFAFQKMGLKTLVMVADDDGNARRVYESVGFEPKEKQSGVSWWQS